MQKEDFVERKKRHMEAVMRKVENRKSLIATTSSTRIDMVKVQGILGGPRLTWDWSSSSHAGKASSVNDAGDGQDDDGGLVVDFAQDSRSALRTHISRAMSQIATVGSAKISSGRTLEEMQEVLERKRAKLRDAVVASQTIKQSSSFSHPFAEPARVDDFELEPNEFACETQPSGSCFLGGDEPTQIYISPSRIAASTSVRAFADEPVIAEASSCSQSETETETSFEEEIEIVENGQKDRHCSGVPYACPSDSVVAELDELTSDLGSDNSSSSSESPMSVKSIKPKKKGKQAVEFQAWLAERARIKEKQKRIEKRKKQSVSSEFIEAEAEESEEDEFGNILRHGGQNSQSESESEDDESDLDDLVASAEDEFSLLRKSKKDRKRLAKLHAKWAAETDQALEKAIEDREFMNRRNRRGSSGSGAYDGEDAAGLSRKQKKLKQRRDAYIDRYDQDGNLIVDADFSESDYDSMEIESDDFFDENSDDEDKDLTEVERAVREERKLKEKERRKRDNELKAEMQKRRLLLKEKLREEQFQKEKDKREIHSGLNIMAEEDREVFKMVNRSQTTVFGGYSQQPTTASTPVPIAGFSFLTNNPKTCVQITNSRKSFGSLELD